MLLQVMGGLPAFKHDLKSHASYRASRHPVLTPPEEYFKYRVAQARQHASGPTFLRARPLF
eukprot:6419817-Pyramimonas_sp.AAC.1